MIVLDKTAKVQIWDTAGQERYRSITNAYYRGAQAIMIVFDLTNKESFNNINQWISEISKYTNKDTIIVISGNKSDLPNKSVTKQEIENFQNEKNIKIFEVSAKTGSGVENAFKYIVETLIKKENESINKNNKILGKSGISNNNLNLDISNTSSSSRFCCQ